MDVAQARTNFEVSMKITEESEETQKLSEISRKRQIEQKFHASGRKLCGQLDELVRLIGPSAGD